MNRSRTSTVSLALAALAAFGLAASGPAATPAQAHPLLPGAALLGAPAVAAAVGEEQAPSDPDELFNAALEKQLANPPQYDAAIDLYGKAIRARKGFADAYYNRAFVHFYKKDYKSAVADYDQAIKLKPRLIDAYIYRAQAKQLAGNPDGALADLNAAEQLPNLKAGQKMILANQRGQIKLAKQDYAGAKADLTVYLQAAAAAPAKPGSPEAKQLSQAISDAYYNRGLASLNLGQFDAAVADYGQYVTRNPGDPAGYLGRADANAAAKKYAEAVPDYTKHIQLKPEDPYAYAARGDAYVNLKQHDKAVADYSAYLAKNPNAKNVLKARALAYVALKQNSQAAADFTKLIALDPADGSVYNARASANIAAGNFAAALTDYDAYLAKNPTGKEANLAYYNRGVAYLNAKPPQYEKAVVDFGKVLQNDQDDVASFAGRGLAFARLGQWDKSAADFSKVITLGKPGSPEVLDAYRNRGIAFDNLSEKDPSLKGRALADYRKVLELKPGEEFVTKRLPSLLEGAEAESAYTAIIAKAPNAPGSAGAYFDRGVIRNNAKKYGEAAADFEKANALKPDPAALKAAVLAYGQAGNKAKAGTLMTAALAKSPGDGDLLLIQGDMQLEQKQFDAAASSYSKAATALKKPEVQLDVARAYLGKGAAGADQAVAALTTLLAAQPTNAEALKGRAAAYTLKKDWKSAAADYDKYLAAKPDDAAATGFAATANMNAGNTDRAITLYDKTIAAKPGDAAVYINRGIAYAKRADAVRNAQPELASADYDRAVADYDKAISIKPDSSAAYYNKAQAVVKKVNATNGEDAQLRPALAAFQKFVELAPNDPETPKIKQTIADLQERVGGE